MNHPAHIYIADIGALMALIGSFAGILPMFAGFLACCWYAIQIWESKTIRRLFGRDG